MKKTILLLSVVILFFVGCKKDDVIEASKVEMKEENIEKGWDYIKISGEYSYPVELETMTLLLSEKEDMSGAKSYSCVVDEKSFYVEANDLKDGKKYFYCYEYDNGYAKEKGEKGDATTIGKPIVVTNNAGGITTVSAVLSGKVTNNDAANKIEEMGFCWGTEPEPTIAGTHYNNGGNTETGTSTFSHNISGLQNNVTYYFRAYAKTNFGIIYGEEKSFKTVEITTPEVATNNVINITTSSAKCGGNVISDGNSTITARGICWGEVHNPNIDNIYCEETIDGNSTGSFTSSLTNLKANTTYYVRAYATNEKGTSYGEELSFTTVEITTPEVTTSNVTNITTSSAKCGGNVTSDGNSTITARGVCWGEVHNPNIDNIYCEETIDGNSTGSFTSSLTNLKANTTYYVRAYATNEKGTSYGEEKSFTTMADMPTVVTYPVTDYTETTASFNGNVISDGGAVVTARGFCWNTSPNPTINNNYNVEGSGNGEFTSNITGLNDNTTYYVRAYATNETGTSYGEEVSFKTLEININGHIAVDLGLPSGLKWATCNVGASSPEDYGDYFAWGETETKEEYTEDNSDTYGLGISQLQLQVYIDGNKQLTSLHDAATANWGGSWRMPTRTEMKELIDNCAWTWTTQNGINGYKIIGTNGNYIFLPAAGLCDGSSLHNAGYDGYYWSSSPFESSTSSAYGLNFFGSGNHGVHLGYRNRGQSVRPVSE